MKSLLYGVLVLALCVCNPLDALAQSNPEDFHAPACLSDYSDSLASHTTRPVEFESQSVTLSGEVYLPDSPGPHPGIVLVHGGGNSNLIMLTPRFFAARLAHCGIASIVYDKRGTGKSGGVFSESRMDDFVHDAGAALRVLSSDPMIDSTRLGVMGFSQGGRLAPAIVTNYSDADFAVSVSGPFTSVEDTRYYALSNSFIEAGVPDSVLSEVLPLWRQHLDLVATGDAAALESFDESLKGPRQRFGAQLVPPPSDAIPQTGIYNSMGRDYSSAIADVKLPWLIIFGEEDRIVPVRESIEILRQEMDEARLDQLVELVVIPSASHSFVDTRTGENIWFEKIIFDWILRVASN